MYHNSLLRLGAGRRSQEALPQRNQGQHRGRPRHGQQAHHLYQTGVLSFKPLMSLTFFYCTQSTIQPIRIANHGVNFLSVGLQGVFKLAK